MSFFKLKDSATRHQSFYAGRAGNVFLETGFVMVIMIVQTNQMKKAAATINPATPMSSSVVTAESAS